LPSLADVPVDPMLAAASGAPDVREVTVAALAFVAALSIRRLLRGRGVRRADGPTNAPASTTMDDFVDP
jgi:hypothetical protein